MTDFLIFLFWPKLSYWKAGTLALATILFTDNQLLAAVCTLIVGAGVEFGVEYLVFREGQQTDD